MKTILCSLFAVMAASSSGLAQSISVSMTNGTTTLCTFTSTSLSHDFTLKNGFPVDNPITLMKAVDNCSRTLLLDLALGSPIPTVTINLTELSGTTIKTTMTITLTNTFVTLLTGSESIAGQASEKLQMTPTILKIADLVDNTTLTCDFVKKACS